MVKSNKQYGLKRFVASKSLVWLATPSHLIVGAFKGDGLASQTSK